MGLADLHIHSVYSYDGTATIPAILSYASAMAKLDVIAITDHDVIDGALRAVELAPNYGIKVIPGCEITTADGHLLALFITKLIPSGLSLVETVFRVAHQGGICIAAHPMANYSSSLKANVIKTALQDKQVAETLVGVETFNSGIIHRESNKDAQILGDKLGIAHVGCSDSHFLWMIGQGATYFPGSNVEDLLLSLVNHTTQIQISGLSSPFFIITSWMAKYMLRKLGWVDWNAEPGSRTRLARIGIC